MRGPQQPTDRREMFRTSARYLALGGIALISGGLIARTAGSPTRCGQLAQLASCSECAAMAGCTLAPALAAKRSSKR